MGNSEDSLERKSKIRVRMYQDLLESTSSNINNNNNSSNSNRIKRIKELMSQGKFSTACAELVSEDQFAPNDNSTFQSLLAKHPKGESTPKPPNFPKSIHVTNTNDIARAVSRFHVNSSAGLSRLKPDHIKAAFQSSISTSFQDNLMKLINLILSGQVSDQVQPYLSGAFLSALSNLMEE